MHENGGRPLAAVFASPGRYIQGAGAVGRIGGVLEELGSRPRLRERIFQVSSAAGTAPPRLFSKAAPSA